MFAAWWQFSRKEGEKGKEEQGNKEKTMAQEERRRPTSLIRLGTAKIRRKRGTDETAENRIKISQDKHHEDESQKLGSEKARESGSKQRREREHKQTALISRTCSIYRWTSESAEKGPERKWTMSERPGERRIRVHNRDKKKTKWRTLITVRIQK